MTAPSSVLDVQVTDAFGNTATVTWVVRLVGGQLAQFDLGDGRVARTDAEELRAALEPKREVRAA